MRHETPLRDRLLLTIPEAAALAGVPVGVMRAAVANRDIETVTVGAATRRIKRSELNDWIAAM